MTPHEYKEQQKARVRDMYSNANDVIEQPAAPEAKVVVADVPAPVVVEEVVIVSETPVVE